MGAVSADEIDRLVMLGTSTEAIRVTGDAAFERALAIVDRARDTASAGERRLPGKAAGQVRLCAGSTWPEDERVLIEAAAALAGTGEGDDDWT